MKKGFSSINFHTATVQRFKGFCRKHGAPYSDTLDQMMDFFDKYQLAPSFDFGPTILDLRNDITKRVNAGIAILRDVEKHGVLPTKAMMELLFEGGPKEAGVEGEPEGLVISEVENMDFVAEFKLIDERKLRRDAELELEQARARFQELVLKKVTVIRPSFGRPRLQLDMGLKEFEELKAQYKT